MGKVGRKAWLVTWEWCGDHARREPRVVALFRPQLSGGRIREMVEFLYSQSEYSLRERFCWTFNPKANPYPAQFGSTIAGGTWEGEIICGHNPHLRARLVDDLTIEDNHAVWTERERPKGEKI